MLFTGLIDLMQTEIHKPFGAHKVAHELRENGFETLVINYVDQFSIQEIQQVLEASVSDETLFVGISNTFLFESIIAAKTTGPMPSLGAGPAPTFANLLLPHGSDVSKTFVDVIKAINPACKIVLGGTRTHANYQNRLVDYVVIGYADLSVVQLAKFLHRGEAIKVKNYKNIYGVQIVEDLLADGFDFNNSSMRWCDDDVVIKGEVLPLEISRGCVFSCKFCSYRLNGRASMDYLKNLETIEQELWYNWNHYGISAYRLLDDTFNDTEEKIDAMLSIVRKLPFEPVFAGFIRLDLLAAKPHTIAKLYDMGFRQMFFGIETLNKRTGAIVGKGGDPEKMMQTVRDMKQTYGAQILLTGSFIAGLPGESKQSVQNTMNRLINKEIPFDVVYYYPLMIMRKAAHTWESSIDLDYKKYGYIEMEDVDHPDSKVIYWKNQHMNYIEASLMAKDFHNKNGLASYEHVALSGQNRLKKMGGHGSNTVKFYKQKLRRHLGIT